MLRSKARRNKQGSGPQGLLSLPGTDHRDLLRGHEALKDVSEYINTLALARTVQALQASWGGNTNINLKPLQKLPASSSSLF